MSQQQDLHIFAGETRTLTLYARDPSNNPQDLTFASSITWRAGLSIVDNQIIRPILEKTGTILDATAGTFSVTIDPWDTMPLGGLYIHDSFTVTDGAIEWVNDSNQEVVFQNSDGDAVTFVNDFDGDILTVTTGALRIQPSVRQ